MKGEIGKGSKEMRALQLMIQTYTTTPQVGRGKMGESGFYLKLEIAYT